MFVCGSNPRLDGFQGKKCRLLSATEHCSRDTRRAKYDTSGPICIDDEDPLPTAEAEAIAEATGHPVDVCLAALLAKGSAEEAVSWLLETGAAGDSEGTVRCDSPGRQARGAGNHAPEEGVVTQVMDMCGRGRRECKRALSAHSTVEEAVMWLLGQPQVPLPGPQAAEAPRSSAGGLHEHPSVCAA